MDALWSINLSGADRHLITTGTGSGVTAPEVSPDGTALSASIHRPIRVRFVQVDGWLM